MTDGWSPLRLTAIAEIQLLMSTHPQTIKNNYNFIAISIRNNFLWHNLTNEQSGHLIVSSYRRPCTPTTPKESEVCYQRVIVQLKKTSKQNKSSDLPII